MSNNAIKIESTDKELSARGGIFLFEELARSAGVEDLIIPHIPRYKIGPVQLSSSKFMALMKHFQQLWVECMPRTLMVSIYGYLPR